MADIKPAILILPENRLAVLEHLKVAFIERFFVNADGVILKTLLGDQFPLTFRRG